MSNPRSLSCIAVSRSSDSKAISNSQNMISNPTIHSDIILLCPHNPVLHPAVQWLKFKITMSHHNLILIFNFQTRSQAVSAAAL